MPSFIGAIKVVTNSGILNYGNSFIVEPTLSSKVYHGSGAEINGDLSTTSSFLSMTLTSDPDIIDASPNKVATEV